jgi:hypothetical protein
MKKTMLWKSLYENDTLEMFVNMSEYLEKNYYAFEEIKPHVLTHLTNLRAILRIAFHKPFSNMNGCEIHLQSQSVRKCHLSIKAKESLMELSCDTSLKIKFEALSLVEFWIYIKKNTWNSHN